MKNKIKRIIAICIVCIGIMLFIYPFFIKRVTSNKINNSIKNFIGIIDELEIFNDTSNLDELNISNDIENDYDREDNIYEQNSGIKNTTSNSKVTNTKIYNSNNTETYGKSTEVYSINKNKENNLINDLYYEMQEYNRKLNENGQNIVDAFSYETPSFDLTQYGLSENIIGIIKIPKIDLELPIYLGATAENLNKGATHLSQTSIPLGEKNSNVVIAAHRSLFRNQFFKNIDKLNIGDEVIIQTLWDTLIYNVSIKQVISPSDSSKILIQKNKDLVTLVTCHPYGKTSERYVVYCERKNSIK